MAITIISEQIYENGVEYDTPINSSSGVVHVVAGTHSMGTRYVVMYTCHTDSPLNQLTFTAKLAGSDGTGNGKYLGMYVTTSMNDEHLTTSIGGDTYIRFGYTYTNCSNPTYNTNNSTYAVGVVRKIIPAGTFYVYITPAVSGTTYSSWFSKSSDTYAAIFTGIETGGDETIESHLVFLNEKEALFYKDGISGVSKVVGLDGDGNGGLVTRVVRYQFVTPSTGSNKVSTTFYFGGMYSSGDTPVHYVPLRFFIGTDSESHANADSTYEYTGELTRPEEDNEMLVGKVDIVLLPNTTYYLWVFPGAAKPYSCYEWASLNGRSHLELFGAAGVVYIDNGESFDMYQCYIDNGASWDLCIPYIDNGTSWDLYS